MQKTNPHKKKFKQGTKFRKPWAKTKKPFLSPEEYQRVKKKMKSPRRATLYQMIFDRVKAIRVETKKNRHRAWVRKIRRFSCKQLKFSRGGVDFRQFRAPRLSRALQKVMVRLPREWKKKVREQFLFSYFKARKRSRADARYLRKAEKRYLTVMWKFRNNFRFRFNKALLFKNRPKKLFPAKFKQFQLVDPMVTRPPTKFFRKATKKAKKLLVFSNLVRKNLFVAKNGAKKHRLGFGFSFKKSLIGFLKKSFIFSYARGNGPLFQNLPKTRKKWNRIRFVNGWKRREILKANERNDRKFFRDWLGSSGDISKYAVFNDFYSEVRNNSFSSMLRSLFSKKSDLGMSRGEYLGLWERHELFSHYKQIKRFFRSEETSEEGEQFYEKSSVPVENNSIFISPASKVGSAFRRLKNFNSLTIKSLASRFKTTHRGLQLGASLSNLFKNSQYSKVAAKLSTSNFLGAIVRKLRYLTYFFKKFNLGLLRIGRRSTFKSPKALKLFLKKN